MADSEAVSPPSIEDDLARLGALADRLEDPEIGLEDAVALYQSGVDLAESLLQRLEGVEQQVSTLSLDSTPSDG